MGELSGEGVDVIREIDRRSHHRIIASSHQHVKMLQARKVQSYPLLFGQERGLWRWLLASDVFLTRRRVWVEARDLGCDLAI